MFNNSRRPDNKLLDDDVDYRNVYYQEGAVVASNLGRPEGRHDGKDDNAGILKGTFAGDGFESYSYFANGEIAQGVIKAIPVALDVLDIAEKVDPFEFVGGLLVSWMMDHVEPLRKALDSISGNPDMVKAYSKSWENISKELSSISTEWQKETLALRSAWSGQASDAYMEHIKGLINRTDAVSGLTNNLAKINNAMSDTVDAIRGAIIDVLSALAGVLIKYAAILLASLGTATPGVAVDAELEIAETGFKVAKLMRDLSEALKDIKTFTDEALEILYAWTRGGATDAIGDGFA